MTDDVTLDIKDVLRDLRASATELEDVRGLLAAARDRITELVAENDLLRDEREGLLLARDEHSTLQVSTYEEWTAANRAAGLDGF